jgi:hypothetical protein
LDTVPFATSISLLWDVGSGHFSAAFSDGVLVFVFLNIRIYHLAFFSSRLYVNNSHKYIKGSLGSEKQPRAKWTSQM